MSAFNGDDYEFASGAIQGLRSWDMDSYGRLIGVTHPEVWRPGENLATCKKPGRVPCPEWAKTEAERLTKRIHQDGPTDFSLLSSRFGGCGAPGCDRRTHPGETTHSFDPDCDCGFWAYNELAFTEHGVVSGVIEGYGKTTLGTRGFRCEKARVVALCRDREEDRLSLSAWLRLQQLYPKATFFEDWEDMVTRHGGVLKQWSAVGPDFWDVPPGVSREDSRWSNLLATQRAMLAAYSMPPAPSSFTRLGGIL